VLTEHLGRAVTLLHCEVSGIRAKQDWRPVYGTLSVVVVFEIADRETQAFTDLVGIGVELGVDTELAVFGATQLITEVRGRRGRPLIVVQQERWGRPISVPLE
jgi:hypothetical protein